MRRFSHPAADRVNREGETEGGKEREKEMEGDILIVNFAAHEERVRLLPVWGPLPSRPPRKVPSSATVCLKSTSVCVQQHMLH